MAWSTPRTWLVGEVVTAAEMNGLRDQVAYLHGDAGVTTLGDALAVPKNLFAGQAITSGGYSQIAAASIGAAELNGPTPNLALTESGQVAPAGRWQMYVTGDVLSFFRASIGDVLRISANGQILAQFAGGGFTQGDGITNMKVHRHPYSNQRHIESLRVSIPGVSNFGNIGVTWTDAFNGQPKVIASSENDGVIVSASSVTSTGCTLTARDVVNPGTSKTVTVDAIIEGGDN